MTRKAFACLLVLSALCASASAEEILFSAKPSAVKDGDKTRIGFTVAAPTDVEVAVLDAGGRVVRHLAAGALGARNPPPGPLKAGLAQALEWDGRDDFGKPAAGGLFKVRVRAGAGVKLGRFIGGSPYTFGHITGVAADEDGNLYVLGVQTPGGFENQGHMTVRVFDPEGRYLREIMPFPANLPPDAMKDVARWDDEKRTFFPRNLKNLNPDFYGMPMSVHMCMRALTLVDASRKNGVTFTDNTRLYTLETSGAVRGASFASRDFGPVDSRCGPSCMALSPDGKWVYLSGPFSNAEGWYKFKPDNPPGRVYRAPLAGADKFREFVTIPVNHKEGNGGAWADKNKINSGVQEGPLHGVAVDGKGSVYVADQEHDRVVVFDETGKEIGAINVPYAHQLAVHPKTGAVYVLTRHCTGYWKYEYSLLKFDGYGKDVAPSAKHPLPVSQSADLQMALVASEKKTLLLTTRKVPYREQLRGYTEILEAFEDKGASFEPSPSQFAPKSVEEIPDGVKYLATDSERDEIYISNGNSLMWRYNGKTGEGGLLRKDGKALSLIFDLAVGYDGFLYARTTGAWTGLNEMTAYNGPVWRLDHELNPAPLPGSNSQVIGPASLAMRHGVGMAEYGIGAGPEGTVYVCSMISSSGGYMISGFGPDGKPVKGKYRLPTKEDVEKKRPPGEWAGDCAVFGRVPDATGGIRVDLKGNIYVGMMYGGNKDEVVPKGFEKDQAYRVSVGSVVKFGPAGGTMPEGTDTRKPARLEGALQAYPGLAPFSSSMEAFGNNSCCNCRNPRFDLDRYGRIVMPNAITNSARLVDNAGNVILEFGKYGNFDSLYVNPNLPEGKDGKPTVALPEIPLAWPTGAGFGRDAVYVADSYLRRVVRVELTWKAEQAVEISP
jgi:hypothetical protein